MPSTHFTPKRPPADKIAHVHHYPIEPAMCGCMLLMGRFQKGGRHAGKKTDPPREHLLFPRPCSHLWVRLAKIAKVSNTVATLRHQPCAVCPQTTLSNPPASHHQYIRRRLLLINARCVCAHQMVGFIATRCARDRNEVARGERKSPPLLRSA